MNELRIYNPVRQAEVHDSEGAFIRTWVPELAELQWPEDCPGGWACQGFQSCQNCRSPQPGDLQPGELPWRRPEPPELPEPPEVPEMPELQELLELPKLPGRPGLLRLPGLRVPPEMPKLPE